MSLLTNKIKRKKKDLFSKKADHENILYPKIWHKSKIKLERSTVIQIHCTHYKSQNALKNFNSAVWSIISLTRQNKAKQKEKPNKLTPIGEEHKEGQSITI